MMAATPMTAAEKNNLPVLDFIIPGFRNDSNTHPFNIGTSVSKYRFVDLAKTKNPEVIELIGFPSYYF
jgi:hypothetical protein